MIVDSCARGESCPEESTHFLGMNRRQDGRYGTEESGRVPQEKTMPCCMMLMRKKVHYFPVVTAAFIISSFFISYGISLSQGNVEPDFPYISYTAIKAPERCFFAQFVNMGAFMLAANVMIRYLQIKEIYKVTSVSNKEARINMASLVVGCLSALGLSMVANFQTVEMRPGHYTGAGFAFGFGMAYCWIATSISWKLRVRLKNRCVAVSQLVNSLLLTVFLVTFGISKSIYKYNEINGFGTKHDRLRVVYLISTSTEWLTAISIVTFVLTFIPDFKKIRMYGPSVKLQEPVNNSCVIFAPINGTATDDIPVVTVTKPNGTLHA
ncbi:DNA damage-regulated autophagy modulator protein 2-like isoform X2 [Gigantopelta aegis]|uniref:DNA damage-regulated autophagy modulator protein 2-like isoform X2 n=1 Tax=Gigantopelta aegis TaxID=1735272 RepID=UPI001B88BAEF|nr:DNA damage-regulated autophagy modulator protein 2-like isoform X2 [Gigantopelta aegis]